MSIYDRDYYRERVSPGQGVRRNTNYVQPPSGFTPVVKYLIIINVAVYILQLFMYNKVFFGNSTFEHVFGLFAPNLIGRYMFWQFITYQFLHGSLLHLFFNMFVLYMIGRLVERQIGSASFLRLYLLGGIFAGLVNLIFNLFIPFPTVGASGSICAILATFGLMNPNTRMIMLIFFFPLIAKARTIVIGYAIITIIFALTGTQEDVAHLAHLGGLIFGWMYVYNILYTRRIVDGSNTRLPGQKDANWHSLTNRIRRMFAPKPRVYKGQEFEDAEYRDVSGSSDSDDNWDSRIDKVLDKMRSKGITSLTREEWEILDRFRNKK